jgi:large subunit ribosomal protein L24
MDKFHVKKGDIVVVISGEERGKRGRVLEVLRDKRRVIVEGAQMIKRHTKRGRNPNAPQGAIVEREGTLHLSKVMLAEKFDARQAKRTGAMVPAATT